MTKLLKEKPVSQKEAGFFYEKGLCTLTVFLSSAPSAAIVSLAGEA
jgi:hypothetical protein